jgi:hypothetical protein
MSTALYIAEPGKIVFVDDRNSIIQYFALFGKEMLTPAKMKQKNTIGEEKMMLETHLTKRARKLLNVLYLSFKYRLTCELWFKTKTNFYQRAD